MNQDSNVFVVSVNNKYTHTIILCTFFFLSEDMLHTSGDVFGGGGGHYKISTLWVAQMKNKACLNSYLLY